MVLNFIDVISELDIRYVEFRVREFENSDKWEAIKPSLTIPIYNADTANAICRKITEKYPDVREVRWNFAGIDQGHYVLSTYRKDFK